MLSDLMNRHDILQTLDEKDKRHHGMSDMRRDVHRPESAAVRAHVLSQLSETMWQTKYSWRTIVLSVLQSQLRDPSWRFGKPAHQLYSLPTTVGQSAEEQRGNGTRSKM